MFVVIHCSPNVPELQDMGADGPFNTEAEAEEYAAKHYGMGSDCGASVVTLVVRPEPKMSEFQYQELYRLLREYNQAFGLLENRSVRMSRVKLRFEKDYPTGTID